MAYIDRQLALDAVNDCGICIQKIVDLPTANVVDKERYDRLLENATIISEALNKYQSADMVEVVRCKDCKHRNGSACDYSAVWVRENGFCQWGERGEDAEIH